VAIWAFVPPAVSFKKLACSLIIFNLFFLFIFYNFAILDSHGK